MFRLLKSAFVLQSLKTIVRLAAKILLQPSGRASEVLLQSYWRNSWSKFSVSKVRAYAYVFSEEEQQRGRAPCAPLTRVGIIGIVLLNLGQAVVEILLLVPICPSPRVWTDSPVSEKIITMSEDNITKTVAWS